MKSITLKFILFFVCASTILISCGDDDVDVPDIVVRDRGEQQIEDSESLLEYLSTHYYNSGFFQTGSNHKYTDIVITELAEGETVPADHTLLLEAVGEPLTTTYLETEYEYYVLNLNQGGGESPNFTDNVRVRYEGFSLESGNVFDSRATPGDLPMQGVGFSGGVIRGWQLVLPQFNTATIPEDGYEIVNGIVQYDNFGLGVMFLPSGLAYFSGTNSGTSYDNLVFKFELLQYEEVDHDGDGIPSYIEDRDANLDVLDDDTDGDLAPNYVDVDDDNDGVSTIDELMPKTYNVEPILADNEYIVSRSEEDGVLTIKTVTALDTDNNGVLDYLQDDISINYNEDN